MEFWNTLKVQMKYISSTVLELYFSSTFLRWRFGTLKKYKIVHFKYSTVLEMYFSPTFLRGRFGTLQKYKLGTFQVQCTSAVLTQIWCTWNVLLHESVLVLYFITSTVQVQKFKSTIKVQCTFTVLYGKLRKYNPSTVCICTWYVLKMYF